MADKAEDFVFQFHHTKYYSILGFKVGFNKPAHAGAFLLLLDI